MSNLQAKITALLNGPMKGQGWCTPEKGNHLALAVIKTRATVVVEIGTFMGASIIPMAMACQEQNHGTCLAIDPWSREAAIEGYDGKNAEWWGNTDHEAVYQAFLRNIKAAGVEPFIKIARAKSDDVEPPPEIDVLSIDGQHTDQAIKDAQRFGSRVKINGFCHLDDVDWSSGGPRRALDLLLTMGFVNLFPLGTGVMLQRLEPKKATGKKRVLRKVKKGTVKVVEA